MSLKKILLSLMFLGVFAFCVSPANAMTIDELKAQIVKIQAQLVELQAQLLSLTTTTPSGSDNGCYDFTTKLKYKDSGWAVGSLQAILQREGLFSGKITGYFGQITASAVKAFQEKYKNEILTPWNLSTGTGYVGTGTIAKLNMLYGCLTSVTTPTCNNLWWYDNSSTSCQQKQFCGAYMYYGLKTFATEAECKASLPACTAGQTQKHTCPDGTQVSWCTCSNNNWACINSPENACSQKSLTLTSPNGGEQWQTGKTYDIAWTSNTEKINIYLEGSCVAEKCYADGHCIAPICRTSACMPGPPFPKCMRASCDSVLIAGNIDASLGKYSWTVPADQELFTNAKIIIEEVVSDRQNQTCLQDSSDNSFSIVEKSLSLTSPTGGEQWKTGQTYNIAWHSIGVDNVDITLQDYSATTNPEVASTPPGIIVSNISASLGKYSWTIPMELQSQSFMVSGYPTIGANRQIVISYASDGVVLARSNSFAIVAGYTCDQKCKAQGYPSGSCQGFAVSPGGFASRTEYEKTHTEIGETSDCYLPRGLAGGSRGCYCQNTTVASLDSVQNQLASIASAVEQLIEKLKNLVQ